MLDSGPTRDRQRIAPVNQNNDPLLPLLYGFFLVHITNAAQKGALLIAADVPHAMRLHAGHIDTVTWTAHHAVNQLIGFRIKSPALELTAHNVHSLDIEMTMNRDLASRLGGE